MDIKRRILSINKTNRTMSVQFYTQEMEDDHAVRAQELVDQMRAADPFRADAEIQAEAARLTLYGEYRNFTIPDPIPTGQELEDFLTLNTPLEYLQMQQDAIVAPPDYSALDAAVGEVTVATTADVTAARQADAVARGIPVPVGTIDTGV